MNKVIKENLNILDWDFKDINTKSAFPHNVCWYPSRYIPQIPAMLINELSIEGDLILDPFCGSGTTLVEAARLNRSCVGIDINPLAKFMSDVKLETLKNNSFSEQDILSIIDEIQLKKSEVGLIKYRPIDQFSPSVIEELESWYHEDTLTELFLIWEIIESKKGPLKDIFKLLFIAITMSSSGLDNKKPYTYYSDRVKPSGSKIKKNALKNLTIKIERLLAGYKKNIFSYPDLNVSTEMVDILNADLTKYGTFDLIVTSPPYLSVTDYSTGFRLSHLWYDFNTDLNSLKNNEIGARCKRKRKKILEEYLDNMKFVFKKCSESLKIGGYMGIVIGESVKYENLIIAHLTDFMTSELNLRIETINERNVNQNYFVNARGGVKKEIILVLKKIE